MKAEIFGRISRDSMKKVTAKSHDPSSFPNDLGLDTKSVLEIEPLEVK